jgi:hypothetical protein
MPGLAKGCVDLTVIKRDQRTFLAADTLSLEAKLDSSVSCRPEDRPRTSEYITTFGTA